MTMMKLSYNFDSSEFDSPDLPGSGEKMNLFFISKLQEARRIAGVPFRITSGYRTKNHNEKVKGLSNSAHLSGHAADIFCIQSSHRFFIINALINVGFTRIGIYSNFIHVDDEPGKPMCVIFTGFDG